MKITWFAGSRTDYVNRLATHIREGRAVLLLGAGISAVQPSRLPLGKELRDFILREAFANSPLSNRVEQLTSTPQFQDMVPELAFSDLHTTFGKRLLLGFDILRNTVPNVIHQVLAFCARHYGLPLFTTNFDTLLQQAGARKEIVFHLHGSIEDPEAMAILLRRVHQKARPYCERAFLDCAKSKHLYVFGYRSADIRSLMVLGPICAEEIRRGDRRLEKDMALWRDTHSSRHLMARNFDISGQKG